jgi:predicted RNA-binding protein with RPS1 domain
VSTAAGQRQGKMINSIQDGADAGITIENDGTIYAGTTQEARAAIDAIANPHIPKVGDRFLGTVVKTTTFGAFVSLLPGKDGLLHITQIRKLHGGKRVEYIDDVVHIGDKIQVEIREVDDRGKLSLVPIEVVEREAAKEDLSGGTSEVQKLTHGRSPATPSADERVAKRVSPSAAGLLDLAARLLPAADRARYGEEYRSELWDLAQAGAGRTGQLRHAVCQVASAIPMSRALRSLRRRITAP